MKIDILSEPSADLFRNKGKLKSFFMLFLALAFFAVLLGGYAIVADTKYYDILEKTALILFIGSAIPLFYVGEKLQAYKRLTSLQQKELNDLCQKYFEIQGYCDLVARSNRGIIFAEYEACQNFAEAKNSQDEDAAPHRAQHYPSAEFHAQALPSEDSRRRRFQAMRTRIQKTIRIPTSPRRVPRIYGMSSGATPSIMMVGIHSS